MMKDFYARGETNVRLDFKYFLFFKSPKNCMELYKKEIVIEPPRGVRGDSIVPTNCWASKIKRLGGVYKEEGTFYIWCNPRKRIKTKDKHEISTLTL
jgi:hypothetical protein